MSPAKRHMGKQAGEGEKWLRAHARHLQEVKDGYDVIMYGDDIVEAYRCLRWTQTTLKH